MIHVNVVFIMSDNIRTPESLDVLDWQMVMAYNNVSKSMRIANSLVSDQTATLGAA